MTAVGQPIHNTPLFSTIPSTRIVAFRNCPSRCALGAEHAWTISSGVRTIRPMTARVIFVYPSNAQRLIRASHERGPAQVRSLMSRLILLALGASVVAIGCVTGGDGDGTYDPPRTTIEPAMDATALLAGLVDSGLDESDGGALIQPFMSVGGRVITTNLGDVQVFEYEDAIAMEAEAATVSEDGHSVGSTAITWMDVPHFFKSDRVIAIYVGTDDSLLGGSEASWAPHSRRGRRASGRLSSR